MNIITNNVVNINTHTFVSISHNFHVRNVVQKKSHTHFLFIEKNERKKNNKSLHKKTTFTQITRIPFLKQPMIFGNQNSIQFEQNKLTQNIYLTYQNVKAIWFLIGWILVIIEIKMKRI